MSSFFTGDFAGGVYQGAISSRRRNSSTPPDAPEVGRARTRLIGPVLETSPSDVPKRTALNVDEDDRNEEANPVPGSGLRSDRRPEAA